MLREIMERTRIIEWLAERVYDPRKADRITYPLADLLRTSLSPSRPGLAGPGQ